MQTDRQSISEAIDEYVQLKIGNEFKFRPHQKETIIDIISNIINHEHRNYVVEAPTGSGKSLINIISAGVLWDYYGLTSYILVSDLFLWEQYDSFLKKYPLTDIATLKGQTGNYKCVVNGNDMKNAECKMFGLSWTAMFNPKSITCSNFDCAYTCEYVLARKRAIRSSICVMTYQLYMFVMNNPQFNQDGHGNYIFKPHDVLFCDECHNVPSIVQLQYTPTIVEDHFDKLLELYRYAYHNDDESLFDDTDDSEHLADDMIYKSEAEFKKVLNGYWNTWTNIESRKDEDYDAMMKYGNIIMSFIKTSEVIKAAMVQKKNNKMNVTEYDNKMYKIASWHENFCCHWNDFMEAISQTGTEYLLKDVTVANDDGHISVAFKCTREDYLVYKFLLDSALWKVFVSATIGGKNAYDENMGFRFDIDKTKPEELNESALVRVPSSFNFDESPVFFLNKFRMSFKERDISFYHLKTVIYSICSTKFRGQRGMIQTGSYSFAKQLYDDAPFEIKKRMLMYNGSREKNIMISLHRMSSDTILVGPTLNTGVDLPGDECRFIIILKVPYPNLQDKLVKEKMKLFPRWYESATSNEIIQGIGRGVRYDGDWCVTYILDACFNSLYYSTREQYPKELQDRIKFIN